MAKGTSENLIAYILADASIAAITTEVVQGHVDQGQSRPYIWLSKRGEEPWDDLNIIATNPFREFFDVEVWATPAQLLPDTGLQWLLRKRLHGTKGTFGDGAVQMVYVSDHSDEYVPRGNQGDAGLEYASLNVEIINYQTALA